MQGLRLDKNMLAADTFRGHFDNDILSAI
jgi:hypothetical protein